MINFIKKGDTASSSETSNQLFNNALQLFKKYGKRRILLFSALVLIFVFFLGQIASKLLFSSIVTMKLMIGVLALLIICVVIYLLRPNWLKKIVLFLQGKLPVLQYHAKQIYDKVSVQFYDIMVYNHHYDYLSSESKNKHSYKKTDKGKS